MGNKEGRRSRSLRASKHDAQMRTRSQRTHLWNCYKPRYYCRMGVLPGTTADWQSRLVLLQIGGPIKSSFYLRPSRSIDALCLIIIKIIKWPSRIKGSLPAQIYSYDSTGSDFFEPFLS